MKSYRNLLGHLACLVAYSIFGFNIIVCKDLTSGEFLSPLSIFTLRAVGAGALFWLISFFMPKEKIDKKDYLKIFAASVLGFFICSSAYDGSLSNPKGIGIYSSPFCLVLLFIAYVYIKYLSHEKLP
jgi:drug/metabolite transporter (DMT)-like permease